MHEEEKIRLFPESAPTKKEAVSLLSISGVQV
jgi:hypothetical protein